MLLISLAGQWKCSFYLIQNSPAVKEVYGTKEGHCEKQCEIQGGGQEMA